MPYLYVSVGAGHISGRLLAAARLPFYLSIKILLLNSFCTVERRNSNANH